MKAMTADAIDKNASRCIHRASLAHSAFDFIAFICVHLWYPDSVLSLVQPASAAQTLTGIDVLEAQNFAPLAGKRVGLITNQTGIDRNGRSTIDLLAHAPGVKLVALFSPEHGIRGSCG